ncbi:MAG TPA: NAD(P)/FAD-dependent oxidoreductase [Pseudonocardia sp.]|jgi:phytoene dehydrogenase-like protein
MKIDTDVIVIGAGHNGLVSANYLADAGLDVTVVEANSNIGGMSTSGKPFANAPDHTVNFCATDLVFWMVSPVARELELHKYGLKTVPGDPAYGYMHPDGPSICLFRDAAKTVADIEKIDKRDARAYSDYANFLDALMDVAIPMMLTNLARPEPASLARIAAKSLRHVRRWREFAEFATMSAAELVDEKFRNPITQAALYGVPAAQYPAETAGSAVAHLFHAFIHRTGCFRPVGGLQAVPDSLANRLRMRHGGTVLTDARVAEITVRGGRATGVSLSDGREINARHGVIASCDPITLFTKLLASGTLPSKLETRARHIPASSFGAAVLKVDLALSGHADLGRFNQWRGDGVDLRHAVMMMGEPEPTKRAYDQCAAGIVPSSDDLLLFGITHAPDRTLNPPGQDTLYLYCTTTPVNPEGGWPKHKAAAADAAVCKAAQYYAGLEEREIDRRTETPEELSARVGTQNGCILHVDLTRWGPMRPALGLGDFRLPVQGLFLGGSGAHPSGGVTGMPGRLAARELLRTSKKARRPA